MRRFLLGLAFALGLTGAAFAQSTGVIPLYTYSDSGTSITTPTSPVSTSTATMAGVGSLTPGTGGAIVAPLSGRVHIWISGNIMCATSAALATGITYQISISAVAGQAAPANGAAVTGTQLGRSQTFENAVAGTAGDGHAPFMLDAVQTGLTPGGTYWIDATEVSITTASACQTGGMHIVAQGF
jgi:hypothetical protein